MYLDDNKYYIIRLDFNFQKLYIIWISDDIDKLVVNNDLKIIAFRSKSKMLEFAALCAITLETDIAEYNVYDLKQWTIAPDDKFDCNSFLNLWNLFNDVAASIDQQFIGDIRDSERDELYDKLFDGSGIFISKDPNPQFCLSEINLLKDILQNGLSFLSDNLEIQD